MVAYSFQRRFVEPILAGTKCQTIRAERKRHARPGEQLQLYTGMRTKHCRLIRRSVCESVAPVTLDIEGWAVILPSGTTYTTGDFLNRFAREDGFLGWGDLVNFWGDNHPGVPRFSGVLIKWNNAP